MTQPLEGIRVVELAEGIAGPYLGKLPADFGADVVKVEPAGGDRSRRLGPFPETEPGTEPDPEQSALFLHLNYLGFGVNFEALCGLGAIRGYLGADLSENDPVFHMDAASGSAGAFAAMMALRRRARTGAGELIELSQSENMLNHVGELLIDAERTGTEHQAMGNRHAGRAPQGCYRCMGDDAWVVISVGEEDWTGFVQAMGSPDWAAAERFGSVDGRQANHDGLDELISDWSRTLTADEAFQVCQDNGVPSGPVLHELVAFDDPHLKARGMFGMNGNAETGDHLHPTHPWRWDGPDLRWNRLPVLGGDNEAVFRDLLGMTPEEYAALDADGHLSLDYRGPDGTPL